MKRTGYHTGMALAWLCIAAFILIVLVVLPDPPGPGEQARLPSVLLDYLFGAIAVAVAVGVACVVWTLWLVSKTDQEVGRRLEQLEKTLQAISSRTGEQNSKR